MIAKSQLVREHSICMFDITVEVRSLYKVYCGIAHFDGYNIALKHLLRKLSLIAHPSSESPRSLMIGFVRRHNVLVAVFYLGLYMW